MQTAVVPKASSVPLPELATYLEPFAPLFCCSTSRASVERYLTGLLTDLFLARQRWAPANSAGFSPSEECPSFPAVHRQVLLWLFQDVVLWLIATNQIAQFRPRRI